MSDAFLEVDGLRVGPAMVRNYLSELSELRAEAAEAMKTCRRIEDALHDENRDLRAECERLKADHAETVDKIHDAYLSGDFDCPGCGCLTNNGICTGCRHGTSKVKVLAATLAEREAQLAAAKAELEEHTPTWSGAAVALDVLQQFDRGPGTGNSLDVLARNAVAALREREAEIERLRANSKLGTDNALREIDLEYSKGFRCALESAAKVADEEGRKFDEAEQRYFQKREPSTAAEAYQRACQSRAIATKLRALAEDTGEAK
jgi:hypothetical protein